MRTIVAILLLAMASSAAAQSSTYQQDLEAVKTVLEKMPSFRAQIKGQKRKDFQALYNRLAADTVTQPGSYQYFYNLAQLLFPLRDNHLGFYQLPNEYYFKNMERLDSFVKSAAFLQFPTSTLNLDSLQKALAAKPADSLEGVFYFDNIHSIGLFKSAEGQYSGVVLSSNTALWKPGQIAVQLYAFGTNLYKAIYAHPIYKNFSLQTTEKFQNQTLLNASFYGTNPNAVYSKRQHAVNTAQVPNDAPLYAIRNLNDEVQYLLIRSFQLNPIAGKASAKFYDSIRQQLNRPYLIIDLRNNEGGAKSQMKKYYQLIKKHSNYKQLYVLVDNSTLSQGELFALKLKRLKHVTLAGQATKGMLTYGSNYGKRVRLPSGQFEIYPTDMRGKFGKLKYEEVGIKPDVLLNPNSNWIDEVLALLQKK